jgi:hypothetical protein
LKRRLIVLIPSIEKKESPPQREPWRAWLFWDQAAFFAASKSA